MADTLYIKDSEDIFSLLSISDQNLPGIDERVTRLEDIVLTLDVSEGGSIATVVADISADVAAGTIIELPAEPSGKQLTYGVANNALVVTYNGVWLYKDEHYEEIGESNAVSSHIRMLQELRTGDKLSFQIFANNVGVMVDGASIGAASGQGLSVKVDNETLEISDTGVAVKPIISAGSNTPRDIRDRFSDVINVKDFGAVGDGVTDDTEAIRAAIAVSVDKQVFFPAGDYLISDTIFLSTDVHLVGASSQATEIRIRTAGKAIFSSGNKSANYATIRGFSLHADADNITGIEFISSYKCMVSDVEFYGCYRAIEIKDGGMHNISNCKTSGSGARPAGNIHIWESKDTAYVPFIHISNLQIDAGGNGIVSPALHFRRAVGVRCDNIISNDSNDTGVGVLLENDCQGCCFSNCLFVGYGIGLQMIQGGGIVKYPICNTFTNFDVDQCAQNAVRIDAGYANSFVGCMITSSGEYTDKDAVYMGGGYVKENIFSGCYISGYHTAPGSAFKLDNTEGIIITGNVIDWCYASVTSVGTNTKINITNNITGARNAVPNDIIGAPLGADCIVQNNIGIEETRIPAIRENNPLVRIANTAFTRGANSNKYTAQTAFLDAAGASLATQVVESNADTSARYRILLYKNTESTAGAAINFAYPISGTPYLEVPDFVPSADNAYICGSGIARWKQLFAATATINTSDAREKVNLSDPNEALMRAWGKVNFKEFQFTDAVEKKGEDARIHFGVIAQQVAEAFASEGLDASRYALFCYDKWDASPAEYDENGVELTPAINAGDRYGIRYSEALALECAYQRWRLDKLEAKLNEN